MKIYIVRHGESTSDVKQKYDGDYDDHLTESGLNDAKNVAKKLKNSNVDIIYSSSKIRAKETSVIIKESLNCQLIISDDFAEQDIYGAYIKLGKNQPEEEYRKLGELLANDVHIDGVESYSTFKKRIVAGFSKVIKEDLKTILIITHGGPIRCIFREILKLGELAKINNGAIIELDITKSDVHIIKMDGARFK